MPEVGLVCSNCGAEGNFESCYICGSSELVYPGGTPVWNERNQHQGAEQSPDDERYMEDSM